MFIGIIAEGRSDVAVLENILKGKLSVDISQDIRHLQPEFEFDETDLHTMPPEKFSNWALVRDACRQRSKFRDFFSLEEERFIVIHIDTAEAEVKGYDVHRPDKSNNPDYSRLMRQSVIEKIKGWMNNEFEDRLLFAIAIEETEAWVLTIFWNGKKDTCEINDPKSELNRILNKKFKSKEKKILKEREYVKFSELSKKFGKKKELEKYVLNNESLRLFCESLDLAVPIF